MGLLVVTLVAVAVVVVVKANRPLQAQKVRLIARNSPLRKKKG